jgi:hypothetical protein
VQVLWRVAVAVATAVVRRNKGISSSLGLGLSLELSSDILGDILGETLGDILGNTLGDILAKYGASLRVVQLQLMQLCMVLVLWIWRISLLCATLVEVALYFS